MQNRRNFLKTGAIAAVGGVFLCGDLKLFAQTSGRGGYFPISPEVISDKISLLTRKNFEPFLGELFYAIDDSSNRVPIRLVEITDAGSSSNNRVFLDGFSLIFEGGGKQVLEDRIYQITHNELGTLPIFMSTVGRSGQRYQAVFCRIYN